ncbi:hypothetical protein [Pseudarthrobacter sp.]|uniref:hypothetical protein n=1 Tax=Pseudarthrobacter sp. TaxID=1934409 RepID=UPI002FC7FB66
MTLRPVIPAMDNVAGTAAVVTNFVDTADSTASTALRRMLVRRRTSIAAKT